MKRVVELDGLRGLFCLGVVVYHVHHQWIFWWWSVMDFFFMASGFVISAQLLLNREAENLLTAFFMRRALRVWPLYFATLLFGFLVYLATSHVNVWSATQARGWIQFATFSAFVEGYDHPLALSPYPFHFIHSWSVSVEEQFYVLFALSFFAMRRYAWSVPIIATAFIATGLWWRGSHVGHLYLLLNHIDALGWGLLLSHLFCTGAAERHRKVLLPLFALCAAASLPMWLRYVIGGYGILANGGDMRELDQPAMVNAGFILFWFGLIGAAALTPGHRLWAPLRSRFARYFGDVSYPLYLTHYMAIVLAVVVARKLGYSPQLFAVIGAGLGIAGAHALHLYVEKPLSRFKAGMKYRLPARPAQANAEVMPSAVKSHAAM
jgi:peptidoglycan/LPS O-acetylase OafA/YrhL